MKRLPILITLLILTACTTAPTPSPSPASTATLTPSPTATATPTETSTALPTESPTDAIQPTLPPRYVPPPTFKNGLPPGAIARLGRGQFTDVELSKDGAYLGIATTAGIAVYDAQTLEELWFESTWRSIGNLYISPDNTMVAGSTSERVVIWQLATGETLQELDEIDSSAQTIAWSPDSKRIFAGSGFGFPFADLWANYYPKEPFNNMLIWDVESGSLIQNLEFENEGEFIKTELYSDYNFYDDSIPMLESEWSADGKYLVVGVSFEGYGANKEFYPGILIIVWNTESGERINYFEWNTPATENEKEAAKNRFSIHPEKNILAAASDDRLSFVDLETGQPLESFFETGEDIIFTGVGWSQDGTQLLTASQEIYDDTPRWLTPPDTLRVWNMETGENPASFARAGLGPETYDLLIQDFGWSPSGSQVAAAYEDWRVIVWDTQTGSQRFLLEEAGNNLRWSPDGQKLLTYSVSGVKVWDTTTGQLLNSIETNRHIYAIDWSPDGSTLAVGADSRFRWDLNHSLNFWDAASAQLIQTIKINEEGIDAPILALDFGKPPFNLAVGMGYHYGNGAFMLWDKMVQSPLLFMQFEDGHSYIDWDSVWDVAWSPDETIVAIALSDHVYLLDGVTGEIIDQFDNVGFAVNWSPDGSSIISWHRIKEDQGEARLINIETRKTLLSLDTGEYTPINFEWSPDGKIIAASTGATEIAIEEGQVYLFDAQSGDQLAVLDFPDALRTPDYRDNPYEWFTIPRQYAITGLVWLDNQTMALSVGAPPDQTFGPYFGQNGGSIFLWDVQTGEILLEIEGHNSEVQDLALSPNGTILASASADGTIILWDVAQIMAMIED